jgi:hypothetical protein
VLRHMHEISQSLSVPVRPVSLCKAHVVFFLIVIIVVGSSRRQPEDGGEEPDRDPREQASGHGEQIIFILQRCLCEQTVK